MATYEIRTLAQLQAMNSHLTDDCVLMNDIDASETRVWNERAGHTGQFHGFLPIGYADSFKGSFDGNGHSIINLYINRSSLSGSPVGSTECGFFSQLAIFSTGKFIKDLNLVNVDITGNDYVGGLVGRMNSANISYITISNVHVTGNIRGTGGWHGIGGFVGFSEDTAYSNCSATVSILHNTDLTNATKIGGFVGDSTGFGSTYTNCLSAGKIVTDFSVPGSYAVHIGGFCASAGGTFSQCTSSVNIEADVTATDTARPDVGGFFGSMQTGATISSCFAFGDVSFLGAGRVFIGGFVGASSFSIDKCGAEGNVENSSEDATLNQAGGFVGHHSNNTISNCYAKGSVCLDGISHSDAAIGGFCGYRANEATISYCYSIGEVYSIGTPTNGGGFTGLVSGTPTETALFWDKETSGWSTDGGSATGKTTTEMKTEATFTDEGWDFDDIWRLPTYTRSPGSGIKVFFSETGNYDNFAVGTKDSDSFELGITTTENILWIESLKSLLLGTKGDEWKVGSNKLDTPISPTNFGAKQQTNYGSARLQAIKINEVILFVDYVKRKVYELANGDMEGEYVGNDMTALAEHITDSGIVCMAHQKNPDSILWCVLTDGSLISMVYDRKQNVIAWSDHPTDGSVLSVCVTPSTEEDDVWITVKRTIDSADKLYIEKFATRLPVDIEDSFFVDSGITTSVTDSDTITGLDHLIGKKVAVLADGEIIYHGTEDESVVSASGEVTLPASATYTTVQVGLPYTSILKPMRLVANGPEGSSLASLTRIPELKISFGDTKGAKYGDSETDLYDVNFDDERLENDSDITGLFSGDVRVSMQGGISTANPILIENSSPFPMLVKSIIPSFEQTGR